MSKQKIYIIFVGVLVLGFLAGNLVYPKYFNQRIDYFNNFQFSIFNFQIKLPHFPEIPFKLGLDLQGGAHLVYQADLSEIAPENRGEVMDGLRDVIERRIDIFGVAEPLVQVKDERLIVELAGVLDVAEAVRIIGETPFLQFKEQRDPEETERILAKIEEIREMIGKELGEMTAEDFQKIQAIEGWQLIFEDPFFKPTALTGKYLERSQVGFDQPAPRPIILLQFNDEGAKLFEELTGKNVGEPIAIYIDNILLSAPVVQEKISGGSARITGDFTIEEARDLVRNLNAGALPVPIELISQQTVGPILGRISLEQSLRAGLFGFLAIVVFLILIYRLPGLLAAFALVIYIVLILALFKIIPVTLTLAGIAGVILSVGMAVDANILIFSRMREEIKTGKSIGASIEESFNRAWPSIRDGNLTTLMVTLILFAFGASFVKGFAFTLTLGILISMFSAMIITKNFLKIFEGTRLEKIKWLWL